MTSLRFHRFALALLGVAFATMLALSTSSPAPARTFDFNSTGSLVLDPPSPLFACAMRRAMTNRAVPCRGVYAAIAARR